MKEIYAVDQGNSKTYFVTRGKDGEGKNVLESFSQPSAYRLTYDNVFKEDNISLVVKDLHKNLLVRIDSPAVPEGMYEIGYLASESSDVSVRDIQYEDKYKSDLPVIVTLGMIAQRAVEKAFKKMGDAINGERIQVNVDMVTGIPVKEWNSETAKFFSARFEEGKHVVKVYLGHKAYAEVEIKFEYTKTLPEAAPVIFSLLEDLNGKPRSGEIFEEFLNEYADEYDAKQFNGLELQNQRLLHLDIGSATSDCPVTNGYNPDNRFVDGIKLGLGVAIDNILEKFKKETRMETASRTTISEVLEADESHPYYKYNKYAKKEVKAEIIRSGINKRIYQKVDSMMDDMKNALDMVVVYGGGSILMKESLYPYLKAICDARKVKLLYIPEKYANTLYVEGLQLWADNLLEKAKKKDLEKRAADKAKATETTEPVNEEIEVG